ncbi:hypothetical protein ACP4OV_026994 [Aristida adscensionis]
MSASQGQRRKTASRFAPKTERCTHALEIAGYSLTKGLAADEFIRSATFAAGGHDCVTVMLELMSEPEQGAGVRVFAGFRLVNPTTGASRPLLQPTEKSWVFSHANPIQGFRLSKKLSELEASPYMHDDCIVIECDITVVLGLPISESKSMYEIPVPPSDLSDNLGKLLESGEGSDVAFKVQGEIYHAHKIVLAMRSPVFKAELYGLLGENKKCLTVEDMQPTVFKALLHFIYTDSLPDMDDFDADENEEVVKHLLVAADRYAMERMKLMCESILCKRLNAQSVATTLALADQHHCIKLKDACIGFINSLNGMDDVVQSQGYEHLKRTCPAVFVEIWEKAAKSRKI